MRPTNDFQPIRSEGGFCRPICCGVSSIPGRTSLERYLKKVRGIGRGEH